LLQVACYMQKVALLQVACCMCYCSCNRGLTAAIRLWVNWALSCQ